MVRGWDARERRAAERAEGGTLLPAVAEDEREAGDAALFFGFFFVCLKKTSEQELCPPSVPLLSLPLSSLLLRFSRSYVVACLEGERSRVLKKEGETR